jgi:UDP-glucose 4-epimerase
MLYGFRLEDWISKSFAEKIEGYKKLTDITSRSEFYQLLEGDEVSLVFSYHYYNNLTEIGEVLDHINLLVKLEKVSKIIFVSSYNIYEPVYGKPFKEDSPKSPRNSTGINALTIEEFLIYLHKKYNVDTYILRLFSLYGPYMDNYTLVSNLFKSYIHNQIVEIGDLKKVRDFLFINDFVDIVNRIYKQEKKGNLKIYNIGTSIPTSIKELISKINELTNKTPDIIFNPDRIKNEYDHDYVVADNKKLLNEFPDLKITPLEKGLELTYLWQLGREKNV